MSFDKWWKDKENKIEQGRLAFSCKNDVFYLSDLEAIAKESWQAAQPQWQPIENAPEDKRVIVYFEEGFCDFATFDGNAFNAFFDDNGDEMYGLTAIGWMSEPSKPTKSKND